MERLTTLLGKPILTKSGLQLGKIDAVQLDRQFKTIKNIGYTANGTLQYLPFSAVFAHSKDAIILKNATALPCKNCITIPLGIAIYTVLGEYVGKLIDFELDGLQIVYALVDTGEQLALSLCIGITDSIIIDREGKEKRQINPSQKKDTPSQKRKKAPKNPPILQEATVHSPSIFKEKSKSPTTRNIETPNISTLTNKTDKVAYDNMIERNATVELADTLEPLAKEERKQEAFIQKQPPIERADTAQIVVPAKVEYTSDRHTLPLKENSLTFTPATTPTTIKSMHELYATKQFLQQSSKEVGTKVLTGKQLTCDLLDDIGNILIEKYTVIAPEHIKKAIDNNKLFQLIQLLNSV